jgi:hypothetical protein
MELKQNIAPYIARCGSRDVSHFMTPDRWRITSIRRNFFAEDRVFDCASAVLVIRQGIDVPI